MSETHASDVAQMLRYVRDGIDDLLANYNDDDPEKLERIQTAYQIVDHLQTLAPEDIDPDVLRALDGLVQVRNASNVNLPSEEITVDQEGTDHFRKFERWGDPQDLDRAIISWQRAVDFTPNGHSNMSGHLGNLGIALWMRSEHVGSQADLEAAISLIREAIDLASDNDPNKPAYLSNLANALKSNFTRHGSLSDLEDAIVLHRKAIDLAPDGHPSKPMHLSSLGNALERRFDQRGSLTDLEDAILQKRVAVSLTSDDDLKKTGYLSNLGSALEKRFARHGLLADIEDAILQHRRAVALTPNDHLNKLVYLNNLGIALERRFGHHGSLADLEDAILQHRKVVSLTPDGHPAKPSYLNSLGAVLTGRFSRYGSLVDLEDAILQKRKAIILTPDGHPDKVMYFNNLGDSLRDRFDLNGSLEDLEEATVHLQKAVYLTPDGHPSKPSYLNNLGGTFERKFQRDGAIPELDASILRRQEALRLIPNGHPNRSGCLNSLSRVLWMRFERLGHREDLHNALLAAQESAGIQIAPSHIRLQGALYWAVCCALESTSSLPAYECAVNLLPRVAWLGVALDDQYYHLAKVGSVVRDAVAAAISEGKYAKAIEWAEQGRSIVWQNLLSLRSPLEELQEQYPQLSARIRELSLCLEPSTEAGSVLDVSKLSGTADNRMTLAIERDRLLDEVKSKPGFESFMKSKSLEQLALAARDGTVIFLNLGLARCDALALLLGENGSPRVVSIPLERVTLQDAEQLSKKLVDLLSKTGVRERDNRKHRIYGACDDKDATFKEILQTLWLDYVQPIISVLAYQVNLESPPRLWWCTTGPAAFLPLHAAGLYDVQRVGHKLSDYVVSSYTPSLMALLDDTSLALTNELKILTVAISNTPGAPLPCTEEETQNLQWLAGNLPIVKLVNEEVTRKRVLMELEETSWAHLACHGEQVGGKPMESGLIVHDGKLKLSEIVKTRLPKADFAFLSACQTAVGDGGVPEESAHLAAGMLFAGYRGVVATMWSIQDDIAPRVAKDFYQYMFRNGKPDRKEAAYALHKAVRSLQESNVPFTSWIPFIHIGR